MFTHLILSLALVLILASVGCAAAPAARPGADALPAIEELPNPFVFADGSPVKSKDDWARRRAELRDVILYYEYGALPPPAAVTGKETESKPNEALGAVEKKIVLATGPGGKLAVRLDLTIPAGKTGPMPVIVRGDLCWSKVAEKAGAATVREMMRRGYILAEFDRTEFAPDKADKTTGVYPLYPEFDGGAEAAWAWGFHRVVDYLLAQEYVDKTKIIVTGHSRGGKAALLAGATDERIALTVPNGSGAGGCGTYRGGYEKAETLKDIVTRFPFWFHPRFQEFIGKESKLPFDQHELKALVAPRALLDTEGLADLWANPRGAQQTHLAAKEVYKFLGAGDNIGLVYREGKHAHGPEDYAALLDFADARLLGKPVDRSFEVLPFPDLKKLFSWTAPK